MAITVLIAEDDRHTRNILEHIFTKDPELKDKDIKLLLAPDGHQALNYFKKYKPNLIISDLLMPKMDGFAFCRAVRAEPEGKDIPLIITSAVYKETPLLNTLRDELNILFFAKPFQVREFTEEIKKLLNAGSAEEIRQTRISRITMSGPFTGDLSKRSVPAIMLDIKAIEGTGKLILEKGNVKKEIFFLFGKPIGAESNIRHESLGNYLVAKNIITERQNQEILIHAKKSHVSYIKSLLNTGIINEELILKYHSSLVKVRIINAFRWHEGKYSFEPGDDFSERMPKAPVETVQIIFAGLKRVVDLDEIIKRLKSDLLSEIHFTDSRKDLIPEFKRIFGSDVLDELESGTNTIGEMLGKGISPMTLYTQIYVLLETEMIYMKKMQGVEASVDMGIMEDPLSLSSIKNAVNQEINEEEEISVVADIPLPSSSKEDSGFILNIPVEFEEGEKDILKDIRDFYIEIHEKDYFSIFGLKPEDGPARIHEAIDEFSKKYSIEAFADVDLGAEHAKLEEINEYLKVAKTILLNPSKKAEYIEKTKLEKTRGEQSLDAEVLFKQAEHQLAVKDFEGAVKTLDKAISIKQDEADYYALYAEALYYKGESKEQVLSLINKALSMNPDSIAVQRCAGVVFNAFGQKDQAIEHYSKVLEQSPEDELAFERINQLLTEKQAWKVLERLHKKLLHVYKNRRPKHTARVAKSLAELYETKLKDPDKAISAWEIVLSVSPDNFEANKAIKRLKSQKISFSKSPEEVLGTIRHTLQQNPFMEDHLLNGFNISLSYDPDMAFMFAAVLKSLGTKDNEVLNYYKRFSPPFLPRAWRQVDAEVWMKISDPEDMDFIGKIFETLCLILPEADILPGTPKVTEEIPWESMSDEWHRVTEYLSYQLSVPVPSFYKSASGEPVYLATADGKIVIAVSDAMLNEQNLSLIAAYTAPLMTAFWTGRALPVIAPSQDLLLLLKAMIFYVSSKTHISVTPDMSEFVNKFVSGGDDLKQNLAAVFAEISRQNKQGSINLSKWIRGVKKSSFNTGLLLSGGDFASMMKVVPEKYRGALATYALSKEHLDARKMLGLSINV